MERFNVVFCGGGLSTSTLIIGISELFDDVSFCTLFFSSFSLKLGGMGMGMMNGIGIGIGTGYGTINVGGGKSDGGGGGCGGGGGGGGRWTCRLRGNKGGMLGTGGLGSGNLAANSANIWGGGKNPWLRKGGLCRGWSGGNK